jgi:hypothetical protein
LINLLCLAAARGSHDWCFFCSVFTNICKRPYLVFQVTEWYSDLTGKRASLTGHMILSQCHEYTCYNLYKWDQNRRTPCGGKAVKPSTLPSVTIITTTKSPHQKGENPVL